MSKFSQGFQSFKEGLEWKLIRDYWRAVREHAWELFWGGGVLGIALTIYTIYHAPARAYIPWGVAWAILVAGYYTWRADHVRLEKKIQVTGVHPREWNQPQGSIQAGHHIKAYHIAILNRSEAITIEDVSVQLSDISPQVPDWSLPIPLHLQHDNPENADDRLRSFNLNPGEPKNIDFVFAMEGDNRFNVFHVVSGVDYHTRFDTKGHRLQITIAAKDTPALLIWFTLWRDQKGAIQCEMDKERAITS